MSPNRRRNPLILGTLLLTASALIARIAGFFYRIFLSHKISTEAMGLYQLVYPMYSICFSLCCGSIQTALSRFIAAEYGKKREKNSRRYLICGLGLALSLSLGAAFCMYHFSPFLAESVLLDSRCAGLLKLLSFSVPFSAVHACICGYYYGRSKAQIPAASQIAEQFVRIVTIVIVIQWAEASGKAVTAACAVLGHLAGEAGALSSSLLSFMLHTRRQKRARIASAARQTPAACPLPYSTVVRNLIFMAFPLMANRLILSILQSAESIMIPGRLQQFGMSAQDALSLYGVLTGMALPFIMFPTAITNSLSVMLLPHIAKAQSLKSYESISYSSRMSIRYGLYIGILFAGIFLKFGSAIGPAVFGNETAGSFLTILAWLCPFLYVSGTLNSIINGLGYTKTTFFHMVLSLSVRLFFVFFLIPEMGIHAYLYGLLSSVLVLTLCHLSFLHRKIRLSFSPVYELLRPVFGALLGAGVSLAWESLPFCGAFPALLGLAVSGSLFCAVFLLFLFVTQKEEDIPV